MWLATAATYLAAAVLLHAVLVRLYRRGGAFLNFLIAGSLSGAGLVAQVLSQRLDDAGMAALLLYALACELYIFLFSMVSSSVSASILLTLDGPSITERELNQIYSSKDMVARRLDKLVANGFLARAPDGGYLVTRTGHRFIVTFRRLRVFFGHAQR